MSAFFAPETLVWLAIAIPLAASLLIPVFHREPNVRETVTLTAAVLLFLTVLSLLAPVLGGARPEAAGIRIATGLSLSLKVEPLGMLFALVASGLWIVNSIYSIGYMRGNDEPRQTGYYVCFAVAIASTMGIAFAKNLFTMFLFYEALTISTYPLVTHKRTPEAFRSGRIYLGLLLGTSMLLFLPAIIATWAIAGTLDFTPGGILSGKTGMGVTALLLALYAFGIGKAALMPLHFWLPAAMVAPTPVSALLHAVAVVKAGVFAILKIVVMIFGVESLSKSGANEWLIFFASGCLLLASLIALTRDNLKARLAYSTVSQLAYVVLGAALASPRAAVGAGLHIATHAAGKITLFFCAGAIYVAHHKTEISDMRGIGRKMPVTMIAFLIGSLSIIGLPPFAGTWSKWTLALGALDAGQMFVVGVLMLSTLLNVAYLLPIVALAFFAPSKTQSAEKISEAPLLCLVALCFTAFLSLLLFFYADRVEELLGKMFTA